MQAWMAQGLGPGTAGTSIPGRGVVTSSARSFASQIEGSVLSVLTREATYQGNRRIPNVPPSVADIIHAYNTGEGTLNEARLWLSYNGVSLDNPYWLHLLKAGTALPTIEEVLRRDWRMPGIESDTAHLLAFHGLKDPAAIDTTVAPWWSWTPEQARVLLSTGAISDLYPRLLGAAGMPQQVDQTLFDALIQPPAPGEILTLLNRKKISDGQADLWLKLNGFTDPDVRNGLWELRYEIPGPSDLVRFALREVWNETVATRLNLDAEFSEIPEFKAWMERQGYGSSPIITGVGGSSLQSWAQCYWRAHWANLSSTQAFTMLHRLRPTGGPGGGPRDPGGLTFEAADLDTALKVNDVLPYWRGKLAAISYGVLRLVDIRRIVRQVLTDDDNRIPLIGDGITIGNWAYEQFRDRGLNERDARTVANLAVIDARAQIDRERFRVNARYRVLAVKCALELYKVGVTTTQECFNALVLTGMVRDQANVEINYIDCEIRLMCPKITIEQVKNKYIKGEVNYNQAGQMLRSAGIVEARALTYLACWSILLQGEERQLTTANIIAMVKDGLISEAEALQRLLNIGWREPDALLWIAKGRKDLMKKSGKAAAVQAMNAGPQREELVELRKEALEQAQDLEEQIGALLPASTITDELKAGRIDIPTAVRLLAENGLESTEIQKRINIAETEMGNGVLSQTKT